MKRAASFLSRVLLVAVALTVALGGHASASGGPASARPSAQAVQPVDPGLE